MDTASAAFFVTDAEYRTLEYTVLKLVNSFYKEISSLICSYVHCCLQVGQVIDVYDDWTSWILGSVIALHEGYVAIHYNGYGCFFDDWIPYKSLRLAPLHTYSSQKFCLPHHSDISAAYKWGQTVYNRFLSSISPGFCDRLNPTQLSQYISTCTRYDPSKSTEENVIVSLVALQQYTQSLKKNYHKHLLNARFESLDTYKPERKLLCPRVALERKVLLHRELHLANSQKQRST